jgi:hypothetical protein
MSNDFNPDWMCVCGDLTTLGVVHRKDGPCYIPEPKREWVGLTYQERCELWDEVVKYSPSEVRIHDFAKDIETKLKEKNT